MKFSSEQHAKQCAENARKILNSPAVIYPNGKSSHEAHAKILDEATEYLLCSSDLEYVAEGLKA